MLKIVAISHSFRLGPKNFDQKFFQNGGSKINIQKYLNFSTAAIHWRGHKHMGELADANTQAKNERAHRSTLFRAKLDRFINKVITN